MPTSCHRTETCANITSPPTCPLQRPKAPTGAKDGTASCADARFSASFLPPQLRSYAGLDRECVVIGAYNRVEIWDAEAWQRYTDEQEEAYANWSEEVLADTDET